MTPAHSIVRRKKYRYYICTTRQKLGAHRCPSKPLPADTIENAVLEQLRTLARHPAQWHDCLKQAQPLGPARLAELAAEKATLDKELAEWKKDMRRLARHLASGTNGDATAISRLADLQEQVLSGERRATELTEAMVALRRQQVTPEELARAADLLDGPWETMPRADQRPFSITCSSASTARPADHRHLQRCRHQDPGGRTGSWGDQFMTTSSVVAAFSFDLDRMRRKKRPGPALPPRVPRLARLLALAIKLEGLVRNGTIRDYATLARLGQVSRARISQVMSLLLLAPDIQEEILFLPSTPSGRDPITLGHLQPIARVPSWAKTTPSVASPSNGSCCGTQRQPGR